MISIVIIGTGNVAQHLALAFAKTKDVEVIQLFSRSEKNICKGIAPEKFIHKYDEIKEADVYIIAVSDIAINEVSNLIPYENKLVVHTSGSVSLDELNAKNRKGVFYPLQTFSKGKEINFSEVPICLEAQNEKDYEFLEKIAKSISTKTFSISSNQRKSLHVAAVFVCNFVNHLYELGNQVCQENQIPFEILQPLIKETASKIEILPPKLAQTGPAIRRDTVTINSHLNTLKDENKKEIYKILTKSIIDNVEKL